MLIRHYCITYLNNIYEWIQQRRTGTGVPHVPRDIGRLLKISYPGSLKHQKKIAAIIIIIITTTIDAGETISYQIITFTLEGNLVHFAAFKNHIGFYPGPTGIARFREELAAYKNGKGSVQFPLDKPIPLDLISRIVQFRMRENLERAKSRGKKQ